MKKVDYIETKFEEPLEENVLGRVVFIYEEVKSSEKGEPDAVSIALEYPTAKPSSISAYTISNYTSIKIQNIPLFKKLVAFLSNIANSLE
jgi:hypothetical protein